MDALPVEKRLELINQRRHQRHQNFNSVGIVLGVILTALSLIFTAASAGSAWEEIRNTQEDQIAERYNRAIEQLGDERGAVRVGGVYDLERVAADSERHQRTIIAALAVFVLSRDPGPRLKAPEEPSNEVLATLTVIARLPRDPSRDPLLDLHGLRIPNAQLQKIDLNTASLIDADLSGADLTSANLSGVNLSRVDLSNSNLTGANLAGADLTGAILSGARLCNADINGIKGARPEDNIEARTRC